MSSPVGQIARFFWLTVGLVALGLGAVGVVLPLLPTTPFILLAAFAFARSSPRLQAWLLNHRLVGPLIEDWRKHGAIGRPAKRAGLLSLAAVFAISILLRAPTTVLAIQAAVLSCCAAFIASRPTPPDA